MATNTSPNVLDKHRPWSFFQNSLSLNKDIWGIYAFLCSKLFYLFSVVIINLNLEAVSLMKSNYLHCELKWSMTFMAPNYLPQ